MCPDAAPDTLFERAVQCHRAGRMGEAEVLYAKVLAADSRHHGALYLLSTIALQAGRNDDAATLLSRAIDLEPANARYHTNLGEVRRRLGLHREAVHSLVRALVLEPDLPEALFNLALVFEQNGELGPAIEYYERAADSRPDTFAFQRALARALLKRQDFERAAGHFACASLLSRGSTDVESARATTLDLLGRSTAGAPATRGDQEPTVMDLQRAADARPNVFAVQYDLARALRRGGAFERAVAYYHCALANDPRRVDVLVDLAEVLRWLGRLDGAAATCRRALALAPNSAPALAQLGAALADQWKIDEAIATCRRALAIDPKNAFAHFQLGNALVGTGETDAAIASWRTSIALDPKNHIAHSNLVWMVSYSPLYDAKAILDEARAWAERHAEPLAAEIRPHINDRDPERRLRIGYVSADFYEHSAAYFLVPLLARHDPEQVEVHCYSSTTKPDAVTKRLQEHADVWHDIERLGDLTAAAQVREDKIDVLVDLSMHTGRGRPRLFACKPAPVQICWLGYPGTTGLGTMNYRVTDPFLDPPELGAGFYAEAPLVLPETFWCYDPLGSEPDPGPLPALRNGYITFGCQNSFHKINPEVLELWARVLRAAPLSRLVMHAPEHARTKVFEKLERLGVERTRVDLVPRRRRREYLETYQQIDIGLDTLPSNGATTSLDALWMGVPVVTLVGSTVVGRAGRCLAMNLSLPELVAHTRDDFELAALSLSGDVERLAGLRSGLRERMRASPLMDAPRFARNLESAYRGAWRRWCAGESVGDGTRGS
jgi:protein O-GlcNAc transferase